LHWSANRLGLFKRWSFDAMPVTRLALALALFSTATFAQSSSKIIIGGVDQRVPQLESNILAREFAEKAQEAARLAAMMALEKEDHLEAEDRARATKAWLDQAWREMEYWRAYAGFAPEP
jgi:hypothetical protein